MTHANLIQFFKDLGESPLQRIAEVSKTYRGTTALEPMWWEHDDPHPMLKIAAEYHDGAAFSQRFDPVAHEWRIWATEERGDADLGGIVCSETRTVWSVKAETRQEALDLAGLEYLKREVRRAMSARLDRMIAEVGPNCGADPATR